MIVLIIIIITIITIVIYNLVGNNLLDSVYINLPNVISKFHPSIRFLIVDV
jgi:hypothetical protein